MQNILRVHYCGSPTSTRHAENTQLSHLAGIVQVLDLFETKAFVCDADSVARHQRIVIIVICGPGHIRERIPREAHVHGPEIAVLELFAKLGRFALHWRWWHDHW